MAHPQLVESDTRDSTSLDDSIEELGDRFRVEEAAVRVAEHPVVGVLWEVLVSKPSTPAGEDVTCVVIEFDGRRLVRVLTPNSTGLPPTFWSEREIDNRDLAMSRSDHFSPTISPRRMPVWAARCSAG